ncbi:1,6-anhydro-N-acetylmuramyl-L-alanine amidase AmpD [Motilimonas sp. 1_MG-2023]|uniref:1,6-anhydro-N-acetylmuramyl-L-alanine amidase AmpD n=1 Tax=Motilimonas sp. 1_MG-2023 TaxID=3062672 RepID=UPI0026E4427A|nr:1,6-anhydro-N-acetylmuramyl-L-alanine amidase AmpD [Motilimonas sp. 1_MG-2023]MDO6524225.1 1,6-anhydro-N-acetylmuramyl-L-alanine amidase AmpD [Motilimonas sp. 1_MG-2023]
MSVTIDSQGMIAQARQVPSPFCDFRPLDASISLLVIHSISLPPAQFGGPYIDQLFTGQLNPSEHPYFEIIYQFKVSAHALIRRDGELVQYVPLDKRAWHAGVSEFAGQEKCNDFSIGIELEGTDDSEFTDVQYQTLTKLTEAILTHYPLITPQRITGHSDIAPGRKSDPGIGFDWQRYLQGLAADSNRPMTGAPTRA